MATQPDLFLPPVVAINDPPTSHEGALLLHVSGRRQKQLTAILARLRQGPATNYNLCEIAINYRARISDLRALGHKIDCTRLRSDGVSTYVLTGETP